jgi:CCR4-NOT transcription complex subunit 7/8
MSDDGGPDLSGLSLEAADAGPGDEEKAPDRPAANGDVRGGGGVYPGPDGRLVEIRDVWSSTLDDDMATIRELVERYPYVAMDTEFPGVVAKPLGDQYGSGFAYAQLQCNVDLLKIIQLGISFCDAAGKTPEEGCYCFQFNFRFDLDEDMYAEDSIQLLKESGIDFARHAAEGVDVQRFGELVMMSGLVLCDDVKWISFHSGYDFGYLLKLLTCRALPGDEAAFFELLQLYFPRIYDVKLLVTQVDGLHGGLQRIAEDLKIDRIGPMHQAGSDSMLTNSTFFRVVELGFPSLDLVQDTYRGEIYGLGKHAYKRSKPLEEANGHGSGTSLVVNGGAGDGDGPSQ